MALNSINDVLITSVILNNSVTLLKISLKKVGHIAGAVQSPTYNCQMFSFSGIQTLLSYLSNDDIRLVIGKVAYIFGNKRLMLIDISQKNVPIFKEIFKGLRPVKLQNEYTSSNGSKMCVILVDVANYFITNYPDIKLDWQPVQSVNYNVPIYEVPIPIPPPASANVVQQPTFDTVAYH